MNVGVDRFRGFSCPRVRREPVPTQMICILDTNAPRPIALIGVVDLIDLVTIGIFQKQSLAGIRQRTGPSTDDRDFRVERRVIG